MKVGYAFRRDVFYPSRGGIAELFTGGTTDRYLAKLREIGFEGVELSLETLADVTEEKARDLARRLEGAGVPCVALRGGGDMADPKIGSQNRKRWESGVQIASWMGVGIVNGVVGRASRDPKGRGSGIGETVSQFSSRQATADDYSLNAKAIAAVADLAAPHGIRLAVEVHQQSIVDNSWSALYLLELVDRANFGINPDLGNIYWEYDEPEETSEDAIMALAPHAIYWHCKNLIRTHVPDLRRSFFARVPLPDGDVDYRFAISAMVAAAYQGYLMVEGAQVGDQLHQDRRSFKYVKEVLSELPGG